MAPDSDSIDQVTFTNAKWTIKWIELYFHASKVDSDARKIQMFMENPSPEIKTWFIKLHENFEQKTNKKLVLTWRKFKNAIIKECQKYWSIELLRRAQKTTDTNKDFVRKFSKFLKYNLISIEDAKVLITTAAAGELQRFLINSKIHNCENFLELEEKINEILEIEEYKKRTSENYYKPQFKKSFKQEIRKNLQKEQIKIININELSLKERKSVEGTLNNENILFMLDTGSDTNVIDEETAKEKGLIIESLGETNISNIVFGKKLIANLRTNATIKIENMAITVEFLVIKATELNKNTVLLGRPTIQTILRQKEKFEEILKKYSKLFDDKPNSGYADYQCEINTPPNKRVNIKYRRIPQAMQEGAEKAINKLLANGYIEPSKSAWANPIRPVLKPNGDIRITCNMQFLNNLVEDNKYTVPNIQNIIEKTQGQKYFTVLDLTDGYYQIKLKKEDRHKTAFYFNNKLYQWTRMPQGFKNSPGIFQMIMDKILQDDINKICNVYLDDIIVYGKTENEHDKNLNVVLTKLENENLKININKIQYRSRQVKILGCLIDGVKQKPVDEKQKRVLEFKKPSSKLELQRYLGFINYYRKYIPNFAEKSAPLYDALKGKDQTLIWNEKRNKIFEDLKLLVSSKIATYIPDFSKNFILTSDASNTGIGAVLKQIINGEERIVDWASKKLTDAEKKYGITEKEFLAMAWAIEHYDYYLKGRRFKVITDHQALVAMKDKEIFGSLRLERMRERLQQYDFEIEYKKGETITDADALSRINETTQEFTDYEKKSKHFIYGNDNISYWKINTNEIRECPKILERLELVAEAHESVGHRGVDATSSELKRKYYWPNMHDTVTSFIKSCEACLKNTQKSNGGEIFIETKGPFEKFGIDLLMLDQNKPILTVIDYYTRVAKVKLLKYKNEIEIVSALKEILNELGHPEIIITDNGKEFINKEVQKLLSNMNIDQHKTSPEKHQSNGRIERLHRTIWQGIRKYQLGDIHDFNTLNTKLNELIEKYNNTKHRAINSTPYEALAEFLNVESKNNTNTKYQSEFKKLHRETFEEGEKVLLKRSIIDLQNKKDSLFEKEVIVFKKLDNDSYLIKDNDKIFKRNHYSLKKIF